MPPYPVPSDAFPPDPVPPDAVPPDAVPPDPVPPDAVTSDAVPPDAVPSDAVPSDPVPPDAVPLDAVPPDAVPLDAVPPDPVPPVAVPPDPVPPDAVPPDPVPPDAVPSDAVPPDAVPSDPVPPDAVPLDAVPSDPGPPDAVPLDAVPPDPVPLDAVPPDPVPPDAVPSDPGPPDAVPLDAVPPDPVPLDAVPPDPVPPDAVPPDAEFENHSSEVDVHMQSESEEIIKEGHKRLRSQIDRQKAMKAKHQILPPCTHRKCNSIMSQNERKKVHDNFWSLKYDARKLWIVNNIKKGSKKSSRNKNKRSRRKSSLVWRISGRVVCKKYFLSTLGFRSDSVIRVALDHQKKGNFTSMDQRGKHPPSNKFQPEMHNSIKDFIESLRPQVSHYKLEHSPHRRYLPASMSVRKLHKKFVETYNKQCSYHFFLKVFRKMNISFAVPSCDLCSVCEHHTQTHPDREHSCIDCGCDECVSFTSHRQRAEEARHSLHVDTEKAKDPGVFVATVDMQKVLNMPKLECKDYFFSRKLVLFNETFCAPGKNGPATCLLWNEEEAGRKACDVANAYVHFARSQHCSHLIVYADNCSAQNKNRTLFSVLIRAVNDKDVSANTITLNFFEAGHTFMAADGVHGCIAKAINREALLGDMDDFKSIIKSSRTNMSISELTHSTMRCYTDELKHRLPVKISKLKVVEFRRGSLSMYIKNTHSDPSFTEISVMKHKTAIRLQRYIAAEGIPQDDIPIMQCKRGITPEKKADLMKLAALLPASKRKFFVELQTSNVADLEVDEDY